MQASISDQAKLLRDNHTFAGVILWPWGEVVIQDQNGEDRVPVSPENPLTGARLRAPHPGGANKSDGQWTKSKQSTDVPWCYVHKTTKEPTWCWCHNSHSGRFRGPCKYERIGYFRHDQKWQEASRCRCPGLWTGSSGPWIRWRCSVLRQCVLLGDDPHCKDLGKQHVFIESV